MNRKRECLQAYFGGLFDGEGSVGVYLQKSKVITGRANPRLTLHVTMCEFAPISLLHTEYPEATFYVKVPSGYHKVQYVFELQGNQAYKFLNEIKPYVIAKHEQVKLALTFLSEYRRASEKYGRQNKPESYYRRCDTIIEKLKALKIPAQGVNSVNALLEHQMREYRAEREDVEADIVYGTKLLEGVETKLRTLQSNKAISSPEKDIVQGP